MGGPQGEGEEVFLSGRGGRRGPGRGGCGPGSRSASTGTPGYSTRALTFRVELEEVRQLMGAQAREQGQGE